MKKQYPVIDSESATRDYNKKVVGFQEILARVRQPIQQQQVQGEQPISLNDHLMSQGEPTYFTRRSAIAKSMGMSNYTGTKEQDQALANALQMKGQRDSESAKSNTENKKNDREYSLKKKELGLKEKQLEASKMPSSDEIANSLLKTIK